MPHALHTLDRRTIEVRYEGVVGYAERAIAIVSATLALNAAGADRLLVDFSGATAIEEDKAHRADFIARTITHLTIADARVALVGVPAEFAWPAELACEIRHVPARRFDARDEALAWLAAEDSATAADPDVDAAQPAG